MAACCLADISSISRVGEFDYQIRFSILSCLENTAVSHPSVKFFTQPPACIPRPIKRGGANREGDGCNIGRSESLMVE